MRRRVAAAWSGTRRKKEDPATVWRGPRVSESSTLGPRGTGCPGRRGASGRSSGQFDSVFKAELSHWTLHTRLPLFHTTPNCSTHKKPSKPGFLGQIELSSAASSLAGWRISVPPSQMEGDVRLDSFMSPPPPQQQQQPPPRPSAPGRGRARHHLRRVRGVRQEGGQPEGARQVPGHGRHAACGRVHAAEVRHSTA